MEQVGGGTHDPGVRVTRGELEASLAKRVHVAFGCMPAAAGAETGIEGMSDAIHVVGRLGFEGGRDGDDAPTKGRGTEKKPGKEVGLEFVLARLAGEDDDIGEAQVVEDGFLDGKGDLAPVGTEVNAAGGSPTKWVAADGFADTEGEGRLGKSIKHEGHQNSQRTGNCKTLTSGGKLTVACQIAL